MAAKALPNTPLPLLGAVVAVFLVLCVLLKFPHAQVEASSPRITYYGTSYATDFEVTNHGKTSVKKTVRISVGKALSGRGVPGPAELNSRLITVTISPFETQHVHCEFANPPSFTPLSAQAVIAN